MLSVYLYTESACRNDANLGGTADFFSLSLRFWDGFFYF